MKDIDLFNENRISDIEQAKYLVSTKGDCLEYYYNIKYFFLCSDCICEHICGLGRFISPSEEKREDRLKYAKNIMREVKLNRINR